MLPYNSDTPISNPESLRTLLSTGDLFSFDVAPSAARAYLHANMHTQDLALKAILNTKLNERDGSVTALHLRKFRAILNAVNQKLTPHIYLGDIPTCGTLLEQLIQEEQLIQAYVRQAVDNEKGEHIRELPKGHFHDAISGGLKEEKLRHLIDFFTWLPQYPTPDQEAHLTALRSRNQEVIDQYQIRNLPPKSLMTKLALFFIDDDNGSLTLFFMFTIIGLSGYHLLTSFGSQLLWAGIFPMVIALFISWMGTFRNTWHKHVELSRVSVEGHLFPMVSRFCYATPDWNCVTSPQNFEHKWLLRSYFALMHSDSLSDVNNFRSQRLMTFHRLNVEQFASLVYHTCGVSFHRHASSYNPYFKYAS